MASDPKLAVMARDWIERYRGFSDRTEHDTLTALLERVAAEARAMPSARAACVTCGKPATHWDYDQHEDFCVEHIQQPGFTTPLSERATPTAGDEALAREWLEARGFHAPFPGDGSSLAALLASRFAAGGRAEWETTIQDVANWISSAMASGLFGSDSWGLRRRLTDVIRSREWETTLKNEEMKP